MSLNKIKLTTITEDTPMLEDDEWLAIMNSFPDPLELLVGMTMNEGTLTTLADEWKSVSDLSPLSSGPELRPRFPDRLSNDPIPPSSSYRHPP